MNISMRPLKKGYSGIMRIGRDNVFLSVNAPKIGRAYILLANSTMLNQKMQHGRGGQSVQFNIGSAKVVSAAVVVDNEIVLMSSVGKIMPVSIMMRKINEGKNINNIASSKNLNSEFELKFSNDTDVPLMPLSQPTKLKDEIDMPVAQPYVSKESLAGKNAFLEDRESYKNSDVKMFRDDSQEDEGCACDKNAEAIGSLMMNLGNEPAAENEFFAVNISPPSVEELGIEDNKSTTQSFSIETEEIQQVQLLGGVQELNLIKDAKFNVLSSGKKTGKNTNNIFYNPFPKHFPKHNWKIYDLLSGDHYMTATISGKKLIALNSRQSLQKPAGLPDRARYLRARDGQGYWIF